MSLSVTVIYFSGSIPNQPDLFKFFQHELATNVLKWEEIDQIDKRMTIFSEKEWKLILPNCEIIKTNDKINFFNNVKLEEMTEFINFIRASAVVEICNERCGQILEENANIILSDFNKIILEQEGTYNRIICLNAYFLAMLSLSTQPDSSQQLCLSQKINSEDYNYIPDDIRLDSNEEGINI